MNRAASALLLIAAASGTLAFGQQSHTVSLLPKTTIPIVFTNTVAANRVHVGDAVSARTIQSIRLPDGTIIPSGARVAGHVIEASGFVYDRTPYALQQNSTLAVRFDTLDTKHSALPLNVTVRALADIFATSAAQEAKASDLDSLGTLTLNGGEYLIPSQNEVRNRGGDVVAYNRRDGVYAHLLANGHCDSSSTEVSLGIFAASACGLYGYPDVTVSSFGSVANPSTIALASHRTSPTIWKHSTALLEVLPEMQLSTGH